jgi:hypothetical protein
VERYKDQIQAEASLTSLRTPTDHLNREPLRVTYSYKFFFFKKNLSFKCLSKEYLVVVSSVETFLLKKKFNVNTTFYKRDNIFYERERMFNIPQKKKIKKLKRKEKTDCKKDRHLIDQLN